MRARFEQRWQALSEAFLARQRRERVLIVLALMAVLTLGGWQLLVNPVLDKHSRVSERMDAMRESLASLSEQEGRLRRDLEKDPNEPLRKRISQLQERLNRYDQRLEELTTGLISPPEMVALLKRMLAQHDGVSLEGVSHSAPQPVAIDAEGSDRKGEGDTGLYAHPVEVTVQGDFHDVLGYLRDLEGLDERLGWRSLDYRTTTWPKARVRIRLHTLSLHKEWLGV